MQLRATVLDSIGLVQIPAVYPAYNLSKLPNFPKSHFPQMWMGKATFPCFTGGDGWEGSHTGKVRFTGLWKAKLPTWQSSTDGSQHVDPRDPHDRGCYPHCRGAAETRSLSRPHG